MNPLAVKPDEAQALLLEVVHEGRLLAGGPEFQPIADDHIPHGVGREPDAWPILQYVEAVLTRRYGLNARELLTGAPVVSFGPGPGGYGWLQADRPMAAVQPEDKVRLTISGMAQVPNATQEVAAFLEFLALLIERERGFVPHPSEVQTVNVWSGEIRERLEQRWVLGCDDNLTVLTHLMRHEPLIWLSQITTERDGHWRVSPSPFIRCFAGVRTADQYLDRVVDAIGLPPRRPSPVYPSSLSLPEAIDYLNVIWRLGVGAGTPLFRITRAEAAAKLALECASLDEFESRLSAFAAILSQIRLPGFQGDQKLTDLKQFLGTVLSVEASERTSVAVDDLRAVVALRVWRQHSGSGVEKSARDAARRLGIALPSDDWGETWLNLRARSVSALATVREELESSIDRT